MIKTRFEWEGVQENYGFVSSAKHTRDVVIENFL
jgi:hypothetical protein